LKNVKIKAVVDMEVIVITGKKDAGEARLMLRLPDRKAVRKIRRLVSGNKYREAISSAINGGKFLRELTEREVSEVPSDLILTDNNAYWNLL